MFIHNTTINIDNSIQKEWLHWMTEEQIPAILATGKFANIKICEVLIDEEMGGITYAIQYTAENENNLHSFLNNHAEKFDQELLKKFQGKYGIFATKLKVISEFK